MLFKRYDVAKPDCGIGYENGVNVGNDTQFWRQIRAGCRCNNPC